VTARHPTISVVTLPDRPIEGTPLRPALWHASALLCCGYTATVSEYKHDASGAQWRTWHISPAPVIPQADPFLAQGSDQLIGHYDCGRMVRENPTTSYLAAYHAARNLDILLCYVRWGGEPPLTIPLAPGRGPIACLVPRTPGAEPIPSPGNERYFTTADIPFAAALITLGFPLGRMTESGIRLCAVEDAEGQKESLLYPDLAIPLAAAALEAVRSQHDLASKQRIIGDSPVLQSPLEGSHLFHWAVAATLRRESLRGVEKGLGHDSSPGRRLVLQGKHPTPGRAVVASVSEIAEHEEAFISHLRRL
jgi:hypothetical protein